MSAGGYHSCALVSGDTVKCWGADYYGQLGNGSGPAATSGSVSGIVDDRAHRQRDQRRRRAQLRPPARRHGRVLGL